MRLLIGARGLLPIGDFIDALRARGGVSFFDFPTLFWWSHGDGALVAGTVVGAALAIAALAGVRPRLCFALSTVLYLSYATACRTFLSFQWDNLLLECGLLAGFLPRRPRGAARALPVPLRAVQALLRVRRSPSGSRRSHDWHDGSAMTFYYETAPLPTWLGWYAHNLPAAWHHFESRATLVLELVVPFAIFGPRRAAAGGGRRCSPASRSLNIATANYGFFCYLALALHVFLLDDARRRARRARAGAARALPARAAAAGARAPPRPRRGAAAPARPSTKAARAGVGGVHRRRRSCRGCSSFTEASGSLSRLEPVLELDQSLRLVNTYHLFAAITRERIEPELQTSADGGETWTAHDLRHKAGDPARAPDFVAPHQPRVDFQLWFYGLAFQRREPAYVAMLVERMCDDPAAVGPLFRAAAARAPRRGADRLLALSLHDAARSGARPAPGGGAKRLARRGRFRAIDRPGPKMRKASLGTLFLTVFLDLLGFGLVIPFLPGVARHLGASDLVATLPAVAYSLMQFLFIPIWGRLSDRVGRRPVLLWSIAATAAGMALLGMAQSLVLLFVARLWSGIATANIAVAQAYIADVTPPERRARGMGIIGMGFGLGFIIGPVRGRRARPRADSSAVPARWRRSSPPACRWSTWSSRSSPSPNRCRARRAANRRGG